MECCYSDECGGYVVSPMLMPSCYPKCEASPVCYPCLPHCNKVVYYCPTPRSPPPRSPPPRRSNEDSNEERDCYRPTCCREHDHESERCCEHEQSPEPHSPPRCHRKPRASTSCCARVPPPCYATCSPSEPACCKPVRTKYVIPCYRYEDGRINQPTLLMRRACEVAVGNRLRKKPFVVSSDYQDPYNEVHRYHSEDEKGNFCFHIERKKPMTKISEDSNCVRPALLQGCPACPQCAYTDTECVQAKAIHPKPSCYFCN